MNNTKKLIDQQLEGVPKDAYSWHMLITTVDIDDQSGRVLEIGSILDREGNEIERWEKLK
jgi:hypothetical protein